jgi:hypothetical protein
MGKVHLQELCAYETKIFRHLIFFVFSYKIILIIAAYFPKICQYRKLKILYSTIAGFSSRYRKPLWHGVRNYQSLVTSNGMLFMLNFTKTAQIMPVSYIYIYIYIYIREYIEGQWSDMKLVHINYLVFAGFLGSNLCRHMDYPEGISGFP